MGNHTGEIPKSSVQQSSKGWDICPGLRTSHSHWPPTMLLDFALPLLQFFCPGCWAEWKAKSNWTSVFLTLWRKELLSELKTEFTQWGWSSCIREGVFAEYSLVAPPPLCQFIAIIYWSSEPRQCWYIANTSIRPGLAEFAKNRQGVRTKMCCTELLAERLH